MVGLVDKITKVNPLAMPSAGLWVLGNGISKALAKRRANTRQERERVRVEKSGRNPS